MEGFMVSSDRRQFQRLRLARPILSRINGENALLLDIGVAGAFVEHRGRLDPGARFHLSFRWQGEDLEFLCEVARTKIVRPSVSHSGVRFIEPVGDSGTRLQQMMATFIGRVLAAQRANANGDRGGEGLLATIGDARRTRSHGYVTYRLRDGIWTREATTSAQQPSDGFTVGAFEDEEELEALCRTYENACDDERNLIRLVAELSAMAVTNPSSR
jgi:hypothetical protein